MDKSTWVDYLKERNLLGDKNNVRLGFYGLVQKPNRINGKRTKSLNQNGYDHQTSELPKIIILTQVHT